MPLNEASQIEHDDYEESIQVDHSDYGGNGEIGAEVEHSLCDNPARPNATFRARTIAATAACGHAAISARLHPARLLHHHLWQDGDIIVHEKGNNLWLNGKNVQLSAGESKEVQIPFTLDKGTYTMEIYNSTGYQISSVTQSFTVVEDNESSNNVDLTVTRGDVENTDEIPNYTNWYYLYGNVFRATIKMRNDTNTDYDGTLLWKLLPSSYSGTFYLESQSVKVPKNSTVDVVIEMDDLDMNEPYYRLCYCHKKGDKHTAIWDGYYDPQPAIMTYDKDGNKVITKPTTTFEVPDYALSIDLTGTEIGTVTPNSNPNCLYILGSTEAAPTGLTGKNVITYDGSSYMATNITLTDDYDFYAPVDFTAQNIVYAYDYEGKVGGTGKAADGTNGWSTIMLPYDVTSVTAQATETAEATEIDWFHSDDDSKGKFWLKKFTSDDVNTVNFDYVEEDGMKAFTPYIIALPGSKWGEKYQLNNKIIKFIGKNVTVYGGNQISVTGSNYRFVGKTVTDNTENIYCLDADGYQFVLKTETGSNKPFRAYFKPDTFDRTMTRLAIGSGSGNGITGIQNIEPGRKKQADDSWYTLDGRRISSQPTQKGIYIVNGKKIVVK